MRKLLTAALCLISFCLTAQTDYQLKYWIRYKSAYKFSEIVVDTCYENSKIAFGELVLDTHYIHSKLDGQLFFRLDTMGTALNCYDTIPTSEGHIYCFSSGSADHIDQWYYHKAHGIILQAYHHGFQYLDMTITNPHAIVRKNDNLLYYIERSRHFPIIPPPRRKKRR